MHDADYVIVGSGINSLVCGAMLARAGHKVCILERNSRPGGCIATEEVTAPGFHHDLFSSWYPLFLTSEAYRELGDELEKYGVRFISSQKPAAGLTGDGQCFIFDRDRRKNCDSLQEEAGAFRSGLESIESHAELIFALLTRQLRSAKTLWIMAKQAWKTGIPDFLYFMKQALVGVRNAMRGRHENRAYQACVAPWVLHVGIGPDSPTSYLMSNVVLFTLENVGLPVVQGGSYTLVEAFRALIEANGGEIVCDAEVSSILLEDKRAHAVSLTDGSNVSASKGVICNVTPQCLYTQLLPAEAVPARFQSQAREYRFGRADMQIHIAMDAPAQWVDSALDDIPMIHLCNGVDALAKSVNEADSGLLPKDPTIVVGQPCALDPSRAPAGKWILWIQLQELPRTISGDAAGEIEPPENGEWNKAVTEAYAERVMRKLQRQIRNFPDDMIASHVISPADLETMNQNLVGGDPYCGDCALDQNLFLRPFSSASNHNTCVGNVFHIGASTHPGPGLHGQSGYLLARQLL